MNKFLKSNAVVIALALVAIVFVYYRIVAPLVGADEAHLDAPILAGELDEFVDDYEDPVGDASRDLQFVSAQYDLGHFKATDLHWNEHPGRDPFSPHVEISENDVDAVLDKVKTTTGGAAFATSLSLPVVSAIVNSRRYRYAVVDGEILATGDAVGNFLLESIGRRSVKLRRRDNNRIYDVMVNE